MLPKASDFLRGELDELERLPVPPGQSVQIERLLGQLRGVADLMAQESERLGGGGAGPQDEYKLDRLLTTLGTPITAMDEGFLAYGAKACGEATFGFPAG